MSWKALFEKQIGTLRSLYCPEEILQEFQRQRDHVLFAASQRDIPPGNIPFLPVIRDLGIDGLMVMVRGRTLPGSSEKTRGFNGLTEPDKIINKVKLPKRDRRSYAHCYYICDVRVGDTLGMLLSEAEKLVKRQKRFCLTCEEGIALCTHNSSILFKHSVNCTGSRYLASSVGRTSWIPNLCLSLLPMLFFRDLYETRPYDPVNQVTPSCRSRVYLRNTF